VAVSEQSSSQLTGGGAIPDALGLRSTFKVPAVERDGAGSITAAEHALDRALRKGQTDVLVVGNGIAGCVAAIELRRYLPRADTLLVTEQNHPTINTPALKQFGAGKLEVEQLLAYPAGVERQLGIGVLQRRIERLDADAQVAYLADGHAITYQRLLLATGSQPTGLPASCPGRDFDGVLSLHRLRDYLDLRRRLPGMSSAIVIGGGYHAAESALLIGACGVGVTWLIRGRSFAANLLDETAGELVIRQIRRQGVDVRLETEVAGVVGRIGTVAGVVTTDDSFIRGQLVVACTGVRPATDLVCHAELASDGGQGLVVDDHMRTRAMNIWAAGDVATVRDPQTGRCGPRAQWYFAFQQGRLAAAALAGIPLGDEAAAAALGAFWHSTQLGKLAVMVAGAPALTERDNPANEIITDSSSGSYRRVVVRHGRLVGYLAVGTRHPSGLAIKRLIDERVAIGEIQRQLVKEDFDVRAFFTHRRLHALKGGVIGAPRVTPGTVATARAGRPG
jgi:NAD(P)H-nitrite reductase large subunit